MVEVEVTELEDRQLRMKDGILPCTCSIDAGGCALDDMTLVIDTCKIDPEVRRSTFSRISLEWRELLVNDGHKLLFELWGQVALPTACGTVGKMRATNIEQLFLMAGVASTGQTMHELGGQGVNFELETRVADFYLEFWSLSLNQETSAPPGRMSCAG